MKLIKRKISGFTKFLILLNFYSKRLSFSNNNKRKQIIICYDGNFFHGGLVDRLKGIISFYEIAKILDIDFKLFFHHPFKLEEFLIPNKKDWLIQNNEIKYTFGSTKILYLVNDFKANPLELIKKSNAKTIIVYCNVDYIPTLYPEKSNNEQQTIWRNNYLELFKVSSYFKEKLILLPKNNRIVFHTRFTTLMGDFLDSTKLILQEQDKNILIQKVIKRIEDTVKLYPKNKIYILSDSQFFLEHVQKKTGYYTLEGIPQHIENNNKNVEFHAKTFLDFYFIMESDMVFFIKIDKMYNSSFSKYASIIGDKDFITLS